MQAIFHSQPWQPSSLNLTIIPTQAHAVDQGRQNEQDEVLARQHDQHVMGVRRRGVRHRGRGGNAVHNDDARFMGAAGFR